MQATTPVKIRNVSNHIFSSLPKKNTDFFSNNSNNNKYEKEFKTEHKNNIVTPFYTCNLLIVF